jgi:DNA-directed RNA polymerase specialized sigma24 family protein
VLRDLEGLDERTVSDMLAVSTGTAKSRLHRARRRFRQEWDR